MRPSPGGVFEASNFLPPAPGESTRSNPLSCFSVGSQGRAHIAVFIAAAASTGRFAASRCWPAGCSGQALHPAGRWLATERRHQHRFAHWADVQGRGPDGHGLVEGSRAVGGEAGERQGSPGSERLLGVNRQRTQGHPVWQGD